MCRFNVRIAGQPVASNATQEKNGYDDILVDDLTEFNWWDSVGDLTFPLECGDVKAHNGMQEQPMNGNHGMKHESEEVSDSTSTDLDLLELLRAEEALKNRPHAGSNGCDGRPVQAPSPADQQMGFDNSKAIGAALQAQRIHAQTQQIAAVQQLAQAAQLQLQAPLLAAMQASQAAQQLQSAPQFMSGGVASGVPQVQQQQGLLPEQLMAFSNPAGMGGAFSNPLMNNLPVMLSMRNLVSQKNHVELDETVEKIKKKRRESAQRSRARKNAYMKSLEVENKLLKTENSRLKELISRLDRSFLSAAVNSDVAAATSE